IAALTETDVWSQETLYLRVNPAQAGSSSADVVGVEGMLADPAGFTVALEGRVAEHVIALASEQISRVSSCPPVTQLERRYLLRDGELMISAHMAAFDQPLTPYLTTRLIKAEAAAGKHAKGAQE
ncbi:MAG: heme-binding beta-barrel domain-containing protein, partial [Bowdeniella nasicola]|nr:heme-binding beta-barrel domain-containing protein [Bowdeniella nasicola]